MAETPENPSGFTVKKKVDESWKDTVHKEIEETPTDAAAAQSPPASEFIFFVSTLGMQALLALGEIAYPATGEKTLDVPQAKYLIDTIHMLEQKTAGNLTEEESSTLKTLLYELHLVFVEKTRKPA
jgi:hypothetical protein